MALLRLTHSHRANEWLPRLEKEASLPPLPAGKTVAHQIHIANIPWSSLADRGFQFADGAVGTPVERGNFLPGSQNAKAYANALLNGRTVSQWTEAEAYYFGRYYLGVGGIIGGQFKEGYGSEVPYIIDESKPLQWQALWRGLRDRAESFNPKSIVIGDYDTKYTAFFDFGGGTGNYTPNNATTRAALVSPSAARSGISWFNDPISRWVNPVHQVYPRNPNRHDLYQVAYSVQRLQLACSNWGDGTNLQAYSFIWPSCEAIDSNQMYLPRWFWGHPMATGTLYSQGQAWTHFDFALSVGLLSLIFGGGVIPWDVPTTYSEDPTRVNTQSPTEQNLFKAWISPTSAPRPASSANPVWPHRPYSIFNFTQVTHRLYAQMAASGGTNFQFARFQVGSGPWFEVGAGNIGVLEAAAGARGFAMVSQTGDDYGIFYVNPRGPHGGEQITVDLGNNRRVTFDAFGCEPVCISGRYSGDQTLTRLDAYRGIVIPGTPPTTPAPTTPATDTTQPATTAATTPASTTLATTPAPTTQGTTAAPTTPAPTTLPPVSASNDWVGDYAQLRVRQSIALVRGPNDFTSASSGWLAGTSSGNYSNVYTDPSKNSQKDQITQYRNYADKLHTFLGVAPIITVNSWLRKSGSNFGFAERDHTAMTFIVDRVREKKGFLYPYIPIGTGEYWNFQTGSLFWDPKYTMRRSTNPSLHAVINTSSGGDVSYCLEALEDTGSGSPRHVTKALLDSVVDYFIDEINDGVMIGINLMMGASTHEIRYDIDNANPSSGWRADAGVYAQEGFRQWLQQTFTTIAAFNAFIMQGGGFFANASKTYTGFNDATLKLSWNAGKSSASWLDVLSYVYRHLRLRKTMKTYYQWIDDRLAFHSCSTYIRQNFLKNYDYGQPLGGQTVATNVVDWKGIGTGIANMYQRNPGPTEEVESVGDLLVPTGQLAWCQTDGAFTRDMIINARTGGKSFKDFINNATRSGCHIIGLRNIVDNTGDDGSANGSTNPNNPAKEGYVRDKINELNAAGFTGLVQQITYNSAQDVNYSVRGSLKDASYHGTVIANWRTASGTNRNTRVRMVPVNDILTLYNFPEPVYTPTI